jgi:hypothetical protein
MYFYYVLTVTLDADVNKPQTDGEYAFTSRHVPYHNYQLTDMCFLHTTMSHLPL